MATLTCRRCGGARDPVAREFDSLAATPGVLQPPEAAGMLSGSMPPDAVQGTATGPVEYQDEDLCPDCRAALHTVT